MGSTIIAEVSLDSERMVSQLTHNPCARNILPGDHQMNLTLSVKEDVIKRARSVAKAQGSSVNQLVREYLQALGGSSAPEEEIEELRRLSAEGKGRSRGWRFDRDEVHARS